MAFDLVSFVAGIAAGALIGSSFFHLLPEALEEGGKFISWHNAFHHSQLRGIIDEHGNILGYELRPLYLPLTFGIDDIMDIEYRMRAGKIAVIIRLKPLIQPTQL